MKNIITQLFLNINKYLDPIINFNENVTNGEMLIFILYELLVRLNLIYLKCSNNLMLNIKKLLIFKPDFFFNHQIMNNEYI